MKKIVLALTGIIGAAVIFAACSTTDPVQDIPEVMSEALQDAASAVTDTFEKGKDAVSNAVEDGKDAIENAGDNVSDAISSGKEKVEDMIDGSSEEASSAPVAAADLQLTLTDLEQYNGKDGMPAYVAIDGTIYDVTDVPQWENGEHNGLTAGNDLTDQLMNISPHGDSVLSSLPIVGKLI